MITLNALQHIESPLHIFSEGEKIKSANLKLQPLQLFPQTIKIPVEKHFQVQLGNKLLYYSSDPEDLYVDRPLLPNPEFNWESAYGLYLKGLAVRQSADGGQLSQHALFTFYQKSVYFLSDTQGIVQQCLLING